MLLGPKTSLVLQRVTETSDSLGNFTESWTNLITISGVLTGSRGRETKNLKRQTVYSTHTFFCEPPIGITIIEKDRFVYGTRTFDIVFVYDPGTMGHHYEIDLEEVV